MENKLLEQIYTKTDNGFDIISHYYPTANQQGKPFKIRDERTPSAHCKQYNGVWYVTDFGEESKAKSPVDLVMQEENCDFQSALKIIASWYGIADYGISENKPSIKSRPATQEESEGYFSFVQKECFSHDELRLLGSGVKQETCDNLSWLSLVSYSTTKDGKTTTVSSTDTYPIFIRECHTDSGSYFYKVYQPLAQDKAFRFFYRGEKPQNYINGLYELKLKYRKLQSEASEGEESTSSKKLPECVICSGERDALCCAARGYAPIWFNSETADFSAEQMEELLKMCEKVYNVPDIDDTGLRMARAKALKHLDLYTVELPSSLLLRKDHRGNPCKDFRDWCDLHPKFSDFKKLLTMAKACKFWTYRTTKTSICAELQPVFLTHFLEVNGFGKIIDRQNKKFVLVRVDGYVVNEVVEEEIVSFTRQFVEDKMLGLDVQRLLTTSRNVKHSIDALRDITDKVNFRNHTINSQTLYFDNTAVVVSSDEVKEIRQKYEVGNHVWAKDICRHTFRRTKPSFIAEYSNGAFQFTPLDLSSHFFRFNINSCRLHWRKELEEQCDQDETKNKAYRKDFKFSVQGARLTDEEREEQVRCLLNRIYSIGYMLHSYKDRRLARICWLLENKVIEDETSSGGSGKSFIVSMLQTLKPTVTLDGRNRHLTENQHYLDRVSEYTDILYIDDATKYFDFDSFYTLATGNMSINAKHKDSKEIDFKDSPKLMISSNFAPNRNDESTLRRILFVPISDYYHKRTDDNDYRETRQISDDFGYELYNEQYSESDWNADYNFLVDCLQFYLKMSASNIVVEPIMSSINKRMNLAIMGTQFSEWASAYFAPDSSNVNNGVLKEVAMRDFENATNIRGWSSAKFTKAVKSYCKNNSDYIVCFNPKELCSPSNPDRIIRNVNGCSQQYIYIQTKGEKVREFL